MKMRNYRDSGTNSEQVPETFYGNALALEPPQVESTTFRVFKAISSPCDTAMSKGRGADESGSASREESGANGPRRGPDPDGRYRTWPQTVSPEKQIGYEAFLFLRARPMDRDVWSRRFPLQPRMPQMRRKQKKSKKNFSLQADSDIPMGFAWAWEGGLC